jgi:2-iminobutanoate/2-iminopropanoate deaminase
MTERADLFFFWEPIQRHYGYSQGVRVGDIVFLAGTASLDESFAALYPGDLLTQMQFVYERVRESLAKYSLGFRDVVRETMYVTDMDALIAAMDYRKSIYGDGPFPATTAVEVKRLFVAGLMIEIEITASISNYEMKPK